jgi:two-component system chemotaxis response regulator CheY
MVLLLEGDPDVRGAIAEALIDDGYEVVSALNGREGLRLLAALEAPCVVLVDLEMPWVDGLSFLEHVRADARFAESRVVGMTGEPGPLLPGVVQMLRKPVKLSTLLDAVGKHCPVKRAQGTPGPGTQVG